MADILTQLQTCLDQLATQYYAIICYNNSRHSTLAPPQTSDPYSYPFKYDTGDIGEEDANDKLLRPLRPDSPPTFAANQAQLVRDLVLKEQQIEYLIQVLPGIGTSEKEQEERITVLEGELRAVQGRRRAKRREMRRAVERLERVIMGVAESQGAAEGS